MDVSSLRYGQTLKIPELEEILRLEFTKVGIQKAAIAILDEKRDFSYCFRFELSENEFQIYLEHNHHDVYLVEYLKSKQIGQLIYLQELIHHRDINNEVFVDIITPIIDLPHSVSGLRPLIEDHLLLFSTHSDKKPSINDFSAYQIVWDFLYYWSVQKITNAKLLGQVDQLSLGSSRSKDFEQLTLTEIKIVGLLAQGLDGPEIAKFRCASKETIRYHIKNILRKTNCRHQNQLIVKYFSGEIWQLPSPLNATTRAVFKTN